ncbi:unnamed protein product [Notodromas monacha]|uniref:Peptidase S1 domain-containing protein n=1 Tax=Notodromas monacha TaxID=399045 RepID=A0A7R9BDJ3_9CRUS|nr:unnamed protein product [Notodromas monacha]CAG0912668.1 unnamed protein product [Notodromas monacha]
MTTNGGQEPNRPGSSGNGKRNSSSDKSKSRRSGLCDDQSTSSGLRKCALESGLIDILVRQVMGALGSTVTGVAAKRLAEEFMARLPASHLKTLIVSASTSGLPVINVAMSAWQIYSTANLILEIYNTMRASGEIDEKPAFIANEEEAAELNAVRSAHGKLRRNFGPLKSAKISRSASEPTLPRPVYVEKLEELEKSLDKTNAIYHRKSTPNETVLGIDKPVQMSLAVTSSKPIAPNDPAARVSRKDSTPLETFEPIRIKKSAPTETVPVIVNPVPVSVAATDSKPLEPSKPPAQVSRQDTTVVEPLEPERIRRTSNQVDSSSQVQVAIEEETSREMALQNLMKEAGLLENSDEDDIVEAPKKETKSQPRRKRSPSIAHVRKEENDDESTTSSRTLAAAEVIENADERPTKESNRDENESTSSVVETALTGEGLEAVAAVVGAAKTLSEPNAPQVAVLSAGPVGSKYRITTLERAPNPETQPHMSPAVQAEASQEVLARLKPSENPPDSNSVGNHSGLSNLWSVLRWRTMNASPPPLGEHTSEEHMDSEIVEPVFQVRSEPNMRSSPIWSTYVTPFLKKLRIIREDEHNENPSETERADEENQAQAEDTDQDHPKSNSRSGKADYWLRRLFNRKSSCEEIPNEKKKMKEASVVLGVESPKPAEPPKKVEKTGVGKAASRIEETEDTSAQLLSRSGQTQMNLKPQKPIQSDEPQQQGVYEVKVQHLHREAPGTTEQRVRARPVDVMSVGTPLFANVEYVTRYGLPVDRDEVKRIAIPVVPVNQHDDEDFDDSTSNPRTKNSTAKNSDTARGNDGVLALANNLRAEMRVSSGGNVSSKKPLVLQESRAEKSCCQGRKQGGSGNPKGACGCNRKPSSQSDTESFKIRLPTSACVTHDGRHVPVLILYGSSVLLQTSAFRGTIHARNYEVAHNFVFLFVGMLGYAWAPHSKIVGGELAEPGQFPYQVSFQVNYFGYSHICGGSILDETTVITAGHCCDAGFNADEMRVVLGEHDLNDDEGNEQFVDVRQYILHEDYSSFDLTNDICLLKLAGSIEFIDGVAATITLPESLEETNVNLVVSGWGTESETGDLAPVLLFAEIPTFTDEECIDLYSDFFVQPVESMICAGESGKDHCFGDSGGPLVEIGTDKLIGIVSWADGCARPGRPGVNTQVSYFIDWITENRG